MALACWRPGERQGWVESFVVAVGVPVRDAGGGGGGDRGSLDVGQGWHWW